MASNPYFAYSIRSGFSGDSASSSDSGTNFHYKLAPLSAPLIAKKAKRATSRACDVCSIRKIKCDNARPCNSCVANSVKCTELRVRKKSGPKSLRKKTIDSIKSVADDFVAVSADRMLMEQLDSGAIYPDLTPLVKFLTGLDSGFLDAIVPLTAPGFAREAAREIACLHECPRVMGFSAKINALRYAVTTFCLVLLKSTSFGHKPANYSVLLRDLQIYILSTKAACDRFLSFGSGEEKPSFETHYYLALGELHQFSYLLIDGSSTNFKYINFQAAVAQYEALEPHDEYSHHRKSDLRLTLWVLERHMIILGSDRIFRSGRAQMPSPKILDKISDDISGKFPSKSPFLASYSELLAVCDQLIESGCPIPEPFDFEFASDSLLVSTSSYEISKLQIDSIDPSESSQPILFNLLSCAILFRLLSANFKTLTTEEIRVELFQLIERANRVFALQNQSYGSEQSQVIVFMNKFNVTSVFLEVLAAFLQISGNTNDTSETLSSLIYFTSSFTHYVDDRHEEILKRSWLRNWFASCSNE